MAAPLPAFNLDESVRLYLAGEPVQKIQATLGVSASRLYGELRARGIPARRHDRNVPSEQIVAAYVAGASENALATQYGVSRGVIAKRLRDAGVHRRSMSEAGVTRNASLSPEERKAQTREANNAARLRRVPTIDKIRHALDRERRGDAQSPGERELAAYLEKRGERVVHQRAVGQYNVDLAINPVAVEVLGGGWHAFKATHAERTPHILDAGWHLVMVWNYEGRSALGPGAAEYLVAFAEEMRRQPAATCQYRVITGQGELLTARSREDDEFPLVPPPRGRL